MHIIYLDESGTHAEARHLVVAGLAVFETKAYYLAQSLDQLQARYFPGSTEPIQFHATVLKAPRAHLQPPYDTLTDPQRRELSREIYGVIAASRAKIFAVTIEKAMLSNPYERGFEEIVNRFDRMLGRIFREEDKPQRGLVVIAESSYQENLELLARRIWAKGHRWGETHNLADIPYFAPAKNTRLLQLADFVANAVYSRYETGNTRDFDQIAARIDQEEGHLHGLVHLTRDRENCYCPACVSRRAFPRFEEADETRE